MKCNASTIYELLEKTYTIKEEDYIAYYVWVKYKDCFKVLIATILSQNSTDKSALKAYLTLEEKIGVTPQSLAFASINDIENAIRNSGLYKTKAKRIKEISQILVNKYNSNIDNILNRGEISARNALLKFKGIGEKTSDVVLLTCKGYKLFPVDTHISRVSKRLGIVNPNDNYSKISSSLKNFFINCDLLSLHHLLIAHGRQVCKARKPLCNSCVIKECCDYYSNRSGKS
ncbi:MAG: endonuclease III [Saccharolobus sp.]